MSYVCSICNQEYEEADDWTEEKMIQELAKKLPKDYKWDNPYKDDESW